MAGRPKITEDKENLIRKRLLQGDMSIKDISEESQVSVRTILKYKKSLPPVLSREQALVEDPSIKVDYTTRLTKLEEKYCTKIQKEIALFEDTDEGWVWHISKQDQRLKQSGMWWSAIVYPESAPSNWINHLILQGFRVAISPLHDKDTWEHDSPEMVNPDTGEIIPKGARYKAGDRKKAHWHIIVVVDKRTGYSEMNDLIRSICHCPYIQKCRSLRNAYEYFIHLNHPNRYQYEKDEIQTYNNFHIEPTKYEMNQIQQDMVHIIKEHDIIEWDTCVEFFCDDPEMSLLLSTRPAFFMGYVKSRYYRKNPNKIKRTEVKIVKKFEDEEEV